MRDCCVSERGSKLYIPSTCTFSLSTDTPPGNISQSSIASYEDKCCDHDNNDERYGYAKE